MLSKEQVPPGFARARAAPTPLRHGELCPRRSGFPRCSGIVGLVYVEDLAEIYARAIARQTVGAEVLNVIGRRAGNGEVIAAIRRQVPEADLGFGGPDLGISASIGEPGLAEAFPGLETTLLEEGLARALRFYRQG